MNDSLVFINRNGTDIEPDKREACRYMGYISREKVEDIEELYSECLAFFKETAAYKAVYKEVPVRLADGAVDFGFCIIENENLYKNLSGCSSAIIFAATVGAGTDRLIMRQSAISPAKGMVCDCIASSAIEVWCDEVNSIAVGERQSKPRFSPGYGGVSLSYQRDIINFLDAERKLGITLSDTLMMIPRKSVTAFIGIKG